EDISKWYVRRSRRRFWKSGDADGDAPAAADSDKRAAYATLHTVLHTVSLLVAPFMPFLAERLYRNLCGFEGDQPMPEVCDSVHLCDYPHAQGAWRDAELVTQMARTRRLVEDGLAARERAKIRVRQPLQLATVRGERLAG